MKRVFLIVLDSCGIGYEPDADKFGDVGANTLRTCAASPEFHMDNLISMGLGHLDGVDYLPKSPELHGAFARLQERSMGKDTTIGHWELAGIVSPEPLPTYPNGFPAEVMDAFSAQTGRGWLCNKPYSGTDVIRDYGDEHIQTGKLIVYTSADSVFQIAAHEAVVPPEQLYEYCRIARRILPGKHAVNRVCSLIIVGACTKRIVHRYKTAVHIKFQPVLSFKEIIRCNGCSGVIASANNQIRSFSVQICHAGLKSVHPVAGLDSGHGCRVRHLQEDGLLVCLWRGQARQRSRGRQGFPARTPRLRRRD